MRFKARDRGRFDHLTFIRHTPVPGSLLRAKHVPPPYFTGDETDSGEVTDWRSNSQQVVTQD